MGISTTTIILYIACALIVFELVWIVKIELRLKKLFKGPKGATLEDTLKNVVASIGELETAKSDIISLLANHDERIKTSIRGVEITRFNPFQEAGSNQSFAIALLNEKGDGLVLSSLYSRDRMSIFAKPVQNHNSQFELTGEEKDVVKKAAV